MSILQFHNRIRKDRIRKAEQAKRWVEEEKVFLRKYAGAPNWIVLLASFKIIWPLKLYARLDKRKVIFGEWHRDSRYKRSVKVFREGQLVASHGRAL